VLDAERHLAAKVGTVRILYRASTISLQAAVHLKYTLGALNMKEEEECQHFIFLYDPSRCVVSIYYNKSPSINTTIS